MTILGAHVCSPTRALIWGDSEIYRDGVPSGTMRKLVVSPHTALAGVGTGRVSMTQLAERVLLEASSLDALLSELPAVLRPARRKLTTHRIESFRDTTTICTYVVVGVRSGRCSIFVFDEPNYSPERVNSIARPHAPELLATHPTEPEDIAGLAQEQVAALRCQLPLATGGTLTVAALSPHGVTARLLFDLARGVGVRLAPEAAA